MSREQKIELLKWSLPFVLLGVFSVLLTRLDGIYLRIDRYEREQHQLTEALSKDAAREQQWKQRVEDKLDRILEKR